MIPRARRLAAAAISGALFMLPAFTGTASATAPDYVVSLPMAKSDADMKRVAEYWKPDRLKRADSYTPATPGSKASAPSASPSASAGGAIARTQQARRTVAKEVRATAPLKGGTARTVGKVFFKYGDKEYWCSASAVASRNRNVVATAAHCAFDVRESKAAEYWIFVPNPGPGGEAPDGIYVGASLHLHEDWSGAADYDYDYAFVSVHRGFRWVAKDGAYTMQDTGRLVDNVGGQGITISKKAGNQVHAFGYPAGAQPDGSRPFDGRTLKNCAGVTKWTRSPTRSLEYGVQLPDCEFSAGASGGPWMIDYRASTGLGLLNGVNSLTWNSQANGRYDAISSPYFMAATLEVYRHAEAG
ncbi:hypothetical protein [Nonomuraea sp. NPDC046570]|uniref:trypsin-like serine peptidase n=1 Tax=Nonomuraea sp. NPDC046570 TaxID=3155255 RepID=UPI0033C6B4DF